MTGLETIIKKIQEDSNAHCANILARAEQEAESIRKQARKQGKTAASALLDQTKAQADSILQKADSAAHTNLNRAILAEKVSMIRDVMAQAAVKMKSLPNTEYAEAVKKLAVRYSRKGSGIMRMPSVDSVRLPAEFEAELNTRLAEKDASLKIETTPMDSGGFILIYGDIEQNCTFNALIESMQEELKDQINRNLFS